MDSPESPLTFWKYLASVFRAWSDEAWGSVSGFLSNVVPALLLLGGGGVGVTKYVKDDSVWPHVTYWFAAMVILYLRATFLLATKSDKEVSSYRDAYSQERDKNLAPDLRLTIEPSTFRLARGFTSSGRNENGELLREFDILLSCKLVIVNQRPSDTTITRVTLSHFPDLLSLRHCLLHPHPLHMIIYRRGESKIYDLVVGIKFGPLDDMYGEINMETIIVTVTDALDGAHSCSFTPPSISLRQDGLVIGNPGVLISQSALTTRYEFRPVEGFER